MAHQLKLQSIVVIEDEPDIADLLALYCRREGWSVHLANNGHDGLETIKARSPDLVILDVGLPGELNGFDTCQRLRQFSNVPVIFLTARDDELDRVLGLELGADDYVTKPFSPREIVARIKAISRRGKVNNEASTINFGMITIDLGRQQVFIDSKEVQLTTREWSLLKALTAHPGAVLSRQQLLDLAWGIDWVGDPRTVDVHVRQLRRKLGNDFPLVTVRGSGYRFN